LQTCAEIQFGNRNRVPAMFSYLSLAVFVEK
jgi:hypothetical protein